MKKTSLPTSRPISNEPMPAPGAGEAGPSAHRLSSVEPTLMRCAWSSVASDPLYLAYHDEEWGVPSRDDRHLFELLVLEGAQAGLSWSTILHKREGYRRAFAGFEIEPVARFGPRDVERLLGDAGIVRNRLKIESAIGNARRVREVHAERGSFADYL